jgi:hypothetical protein
MNKETVEDAANKWLLENLPGTLPENYDISFFKAGATWQEQQEANDAIEFAEWSRSQEDLGYDSENKIWGYVTRDANGEFTDEKEYTSKEMYELWKNKQ